MKLFGRKSNDQQPVVPQLDQYYAEEPKWKLWVRRAVAAIVVLLILVAVGWAAWAVYNRVTDDGVNDDTAIEDQSGANNNEGGADQDTDEAKDENGGKASSDDATLPGAAQQDGGSTPTGSSPQGATPTAPVAGDTSGKAGSQTMPKTGPADTALIVVSAAFLGALGHYAVQNRRAISRR